MMLAACTCPLSHGKLAQGAACSRDARWPARDLCNVQAIARNTGSLFLSKAHFHYMAVQLIEGHAGSLGFQE